MQRIDDCNVIYLAYMNHGDKQWFAQYIIKQCFIGLVMYKNGLPYSPGYDKCIWKLLYVDVYCHVQKSTYTLSRGQDNVSRKLLYVDVSCHIQISTYFISWLGQCILKTTVYCGLLCTKTDVYNLVVLTSTQLRNHCVSYLVLYKKKLTSSCRCRTSMYLENHCIFCHYYAQISTYLKSRIVLTKYLATKQMYLLSRFVQESTHLIPWLKQCIQKTTICIIMYKNRLT